MTTTTTFRLSRVAPGYTRTELANGHFVSVNSLNGFFRPSHATSLRDATGKAVGMFDFEWSSQLLLRLNDGEVITSDSWIGLLQLVIPRFS